MKTRSLTLIGLLGTLICLVSRAADDSPKQVDAIAGISACVLRYGGFGECVSQLPDSQVMASPAWDISTGPPPLLPTKAESIAKRQIEAFVAPYAEAFVLPYVSRIEPLLFSYQRTRLVKRDETHWFYAIQFIQHPAGGSSGIWPSIELFVTFDGKTGSLKLLSPPKDQ